MNTSAPSSRDDPLVEQATRIILRPIANPLPLGFIALATGTLLLSALQLEWLQPTEGRTIAVILLVFVAPLQLIASIFGYLARDAIAGTGMGILAGTWLSISLTMRDQPPGATSHALGLLLLISATSMLIPAAGSAFGKLAATPVSSGAGPPTVGAGDGSPSLPATFEMSTAATLNNGCLETGSHAVSVSSLAARARPAPGSESSLVSQ